MTKVFSPNMLKTFEMCPRKFYFRYIKNISMPVNDDIFEMGKNIHALASYLLKKENIYKMEDALSEKEKNIWNYLKSLKYFSFETINTEYNLTTKIDQYFFGGRLDALVKKENTYYILDYKTGSAPKNSKYDFQTIIYLYAVSEFFNTENVIFTYIDLKNKTEITIPLTKELKFEYKTKLLQIAKEISNSDYSKINKLCDCEYNNICY